MTQESLIPETLPLLQRGDIKLLVLRVLEERPMHGYEIMKVLEARCHGFYKPSPGSIYPALRTLRRRGHVEVTGGGRRKTYLITPAGRAELEGRREKVRQSLQEFEKMVGPERAELLRELRTTGKLLTTNLRHVTPDQARELTVLVRRFRENMMRALAK